eukprot:TRINITY_DN29846_c0_g1_i1.p1 TRINITY_DN29846_c0_g1~~TRINITY_DN29846_c0_g1_i1.p1  ORF type:complete len:748 (-),score=122.42 TRINITY_DN29846_c0_g1_i1:71-2314(-)
MLLSSQHSPWKIVLQKGSPASEESMPGSDLQAGLLKEKDSWGTGVSVSRQSFILGSQTHRLPFKVMWMITLATAACMALINFMTIFLIEYAVRFKFAVMQWAISTAGVAYGILALTAISVVFATIGVCLIQFVAPSCGGSGLPENKCYLNGSSLPGFFTKRTLRVRVATTILANAAGFPVGREGPTVVIGSNVAFLISEALATPYVQQWVDLTQSQGGDRNAVIVDEERFAHATRIACGVGGACGMAMIFNAPFGGLLYMFEEITSTSWPLELTFRVFVATMSCSFISYGLLNLCGKDIKEFVIYAFFPQSKEWHWIDVPFFIILAAILGLITSLHTRAMLGIAAWRQRVANRIPWQPGAKILETILYAALCALCSAAVSFLGQCAAEGESGLQYVQFNCPEGEYNPIASLLVNTSHSSVKLLFSGNNAGEIHFASSMWAFMAYFALNVGLTGLPVPGGAFTATMLLGGLFGRAMGAACRELGLVNTVSGVYAVVGSAAMLCGFKQMTLAVVLIVVECVNDLAIAPVVMLSVTVAILVNRAVNKRGHDEEQIERKKLPFLDGETPEVFDDVLASSLCDPLPEVAKLTYQAPIARVKEALVAHDGRVHVFPVLDDFGSCVGTVGRRHLEAALEVASEALDPTPRTSRRTRSRAFLADPFEATSQGDVQRVNSWMGDGRKDKMLPIHRIMDPTPFMILEDMPAPRLYALFAKAGERAACVVSRDGQFSGLVSREGLIEAARHWPELPSR